MSEKLYTKRKLLTFLMRKAQLAGLTPWERQMLLEIEDAYRCETVTDADGSGVQLIRINRRLDGAPAWTSEQEQKFDLLCAEVAQYADELRGHTVSDKISWRNDCRPGAIERLREAHMLLDNEEALRIETTSA